MDNVIDPEIRQVLQAVHYRPAISIILPIEARYSLTTEMAQKLKVTSDQVDHHLRKYYPSEVCETVMQKLRNVIAGLVLPAAKKGLAIYVSPLFQKVLYLDYSVSEKITVDESFELRELVLDADQRIEFVLLVLSSRKCKTYLGDGTSLTPLPSRIPKSVHAYVKDAPERVGNFSDMTEHRQIAVNKFLYHIDEELGNLINEKKMPIIVLGTEKILGQFKKISKHARSVIGYVQGNYEGATTAELTALTGPHISAWKISRQQELPQRLEEAAGKHRLATGMLQVWQQAHAGNGQLLVVEKNYTFVAQHGPEPGIIEAAQDTYNHFATISDAVDDAIEKVLLAGGQIAFVEDGTLEHFGHIALIKYFE